MTRQLTLVALLVALLTPLSASAQTVTLDLAGQTDQTIPALGTEIRFLIINSLPVKYGVQVIDRIAAIQPLTAPGAQPPPPDLAKAAAAKACAALQTAHDVVDPAKMENKTEGDVKTMVAKIKQDSGECNDAEKREIEIELAKTRLEVTPAYPVAEGHELVLVVTRQDGDKVRTWTMTVQGPSRGQWVTTYGISFVQDKDQKFFSKVTGDKEFTITKQADQEHALKPLPAVFFTWLPRKGQDHNVIIGPTGGFGLEGGNRPAIFGGATFTYNWNLAFVIGAGIVPETRLSGVYTEGQKVTENLGADALHVTSAHARVFIAGTFRFGSNPFVSSDSSKKSDAKK